ncbi:kunitz-type protease inhibitor 1-like [Argiope bruennichi]|uniref:kunitz-type protease inhibitor 1-like n=1 Tax=Argiope bruennichi TaxID=94029 RepID=UPI002494A887|nr:kunitz-type protease inhibitor 1-like [Argiope bruennichi]
MKLFFGFLLITVATGDKFKIIQDEFIYQATRIEECGANEEYHSCGSTCFPTCFIHHYPQICLRMCIPGCYCKRGFVQARNGSCIRFSDCPRDTENTSLIRNCLDVPEDGNCRADIAMWYYDQESGFCRRFYYSGCDGNGNRYASEEECLQHCKGELFQKHECGENSHYNGCGTPSSVTCENYENPPEYRMMMCKTGCQCNEGYVQTEDGNCVLPEDCPRKNES